MSIIEKINHNRELKLAGKTIGFPLYYVYPRLENYLPSIPTGKNIMITSFSGVGKTKLVKGTFIWPAIALGEIMDDFDPIFILNLLEEEKEEFKDSFLCDYIFRKTNGSVIIDPLELLSFGAKALTEEKYKVVRELEEECFALMDKYIILEDGIYNPTGIYKHCRHYSDKWGTHYYTNLVPVKNPVYITKEEYNKLSKDNRRNWKYSHYVKHNKKQHPYVITDHLALLAPEVDPVSKVYLNTKACMDKWSFDYGRKNITKHWGWNVIDVVQQSQSSEEQQFTFKGESILAKVKPSLGNLGDSKSLQRNYHVILSLFNPCRHISDSRGTEYDGYDFEILKNNFRVLSILKNRIGRDGVELPLYFNGAVNFFKELPLPNGMTPDIYHKIRNNQVKTKFK